MKRFAVLVALLLAGSVVPAMAPSEAAPVRTMRVERQYGDGPVHVPRKVDRVVITFDGRRGDRVRLVGTTCEPSLRLDGRRLRAGATGFFRLPARGEYELHWRRCVRFTALSLQLQKLRVHALRADEGAVRVPGGLRSRGFVQGVALTVPSEGRVQVTRTDGLYWSTILLPDGTAYTGAVCRQDVACEEPGPLFLEAGRPLGSWEGPYSGPAGEPYVLAAGDRLVLLVDGPAKLVARTTVTHPMTLDGPAVDLSGARRHQEVALEVAVQAGQWFRIEKVAGAMEGYAELLMPDGTQQPTSWTYRIDYWQAPVSGTYRVLLRTWKDTIDATVRLRTMREVSTPLPIDGTPVEYAVTNPGEWVVAPVVGTDSTLRQLAGTASPTATGWFADAEIRRRKYCAIYGANACGDLVGTYVDASVPGPGGNPYYGTAVNEPATVVVGMASDVTGTVTVRLTPPPLVMRSQTLAHAADAPVRTVTREYGDGPVRLSRGEEGVRIVFHGARGDRVNVRGGSGCRPVLRAPDGSAVRRERSHFWRLPERGSYLVEYSRCARAGQHTVRLQLVELLVHPLRADGPALRLRKRGGYVQAVAVRVPASGRVQVTPYNVNANLSVILPDGRRHGAHSRFVIQPDLVLEAGRPLSAQDAPLPGLANDPLQAGDRIVVVARRNLWVRASSSVVEPVTVDGPAVRVGNGGVPYRETELRFDGHAGQWVHLEQVGRLVPKDEFWRRPQLVDPDGKVLTPARADDAYWRLPRDGTYRLLVETGRPSAHARVRVRTLVPVSTPMPTDGSPLTFTVSDPGGWAYATFEMPTAGVQLHRVSATTTGAWKAFAETTQRYRCEIGPRGAQGCGDFSWGLVLPAHADSGLLAGRADGEQWVVAVAMAPGETGTVTLRLNPPTARR